MTPGKPASPEGNWDWLEIGRRVKAKREAASPPGGKLSQGRFGAAYGLDQGQISKLENAEYSEPTLEIERALTAMLGKKVMRSLVDVPAPEVGEIERIGKLALREDLPPIERARPMQEQRHPDQKLIDEVIGMPLSRDEQAICFPLCRALVHLLRRNDHTFAHLLEQTRWALKVEGDGDNEDLRELIRRFEKIKGYSVVPGKPAEEGGRRRK